MYKIIIDKNYNKYSPLIILSEVNIFEFNIKKFKTAYILIDNLNVFYKKYKQFPDNCIFILTKNIYIDIEDLEIVYIDSDFDYKFNFKNNIIKHNFIKAYV